MSDGWIEVRTEGRVSVLSIKRPEKRNAINRAMYSAMAEAVEAAEADDGVRALLFTASGGDFTSGNDLADFLDPATFTDASPVLRFIRDIAFAKKPLIAAVEGLAIGIGVTMLLHCDLVYAGEGARFQLPFVNLGLCPEAGSSMLLPALAGRVQAAELMLLGEPFGAAKARECGIINAVLPDGEAHAMAISKAQALALQPPAAVRLAKELMARSRAAAMGETIELEARSFRGRLSSPEAAEALAAFMGKRKPDFSGFS